MLPGMKGVALKPSEHCFRGLQCRLNFKNYFSLKKLHALDLIHFDVCGPMATKTISGASYIATFIDCFSKKIWGCVLKFKNQVQDAFMKFHDSVES